MNTKTYKQTQDKVQSILVSHPECRDNDQLLCVKVWAMELENNPESWFFMLYSSGQLTNSDTITRARRKLQEEHHSLRGEKYYERHKRQKEVQLELGYDVK